jgi:hypothetical protein
VWFIVLAVAAFTRRVPHSSKFRLPVASWRGRQSVSHEVDADIGVARVSARRRVLGAVHVAQQAIFAGVRGRLRK